MSFSHSSPIHSSFCSFIHSAVCFPPLQQLFTQWSWRDRQHWLISAFLSRHSPAHEWLELNEKRSKGSAWSTVCLCNVYLCRRHYYACNVTSWAQLWKHKSEYCHCNSRYTIYHQAVQWLIHDKELNWFMQGKKNLPVLIDDWHENDIRNVMDEVINYMVFDTFDPFRHYTWNWKYGSNFVLGYWHTIWPIW